MKCYIYCTKAKPTLYKQFSGYDNEGKMQNITYHLTKELGGCPLNGKIVASFDLNKVDMYDLPRLEHYGYIGLIKNTLKYSCLNYEKLEEYVGNKDFYAWHIENLKILDEPLGLYDCLKRYEVEPNFTNVKHMLKAPQSWCYAEIEDEECILISIKPEWVCKILNGEKTIEVRKTAPKELIK